VYLLLQYVCTTALHLVPPPVASWLSPSWQHLHLSPFVAHFNLSQLFFVAIVDKVVTFFTFLKQDSTAKTKTACKRSWHQSPARILRLVVVCLHVVPVVRLKSSDRLEKLRRCFLLFSFQLWRRSSQRGKKWVDILVVNNDCLWL
jgi:hypothetical protein